MNFAMVALVVRKDLRSRSGTLAMLWLLLVLQACLPLLRSWYGVVPALLWSELALTATGAWLLMSLLVDFIHADHTGDSCAFLSTRPLDRAGLIFAKLAAWWVAAALPVLLALLVRLGLHRLELRMEDYVRTGLRNTLLLLAAYGVVAALAAAIRHRRAAIGLSVYVLIMTRLEYARVHETLWDNLSDEGLGVWVWEKSRLIAMWTLLMGGGFALAAAVLARARLKALLAVILAVGLLGASARFAWPVNLVWRDERVHEEDDAHLARVREQWRLEPDEEVIFRSGASSSWQDGGMEFYAHGGGALLPTRIVGPTVHEWPEITGYEAAMRFQDGRVWHTGAKPYGVQEVALTHNASEHLWSELDIETATGLAQTLPQPDTLVATLGLPAALLPAIRDHYRAGGGRRFPRLDAPIVFMNDEMWHGLVRRPAYTPPPPPPPEGSKVRLSGQVDCRWVRPAVLAKLPLKPGASFVRDGHFAQIRSIAIIKGKMEIQLSLDRCEGLLQSWSGKPVEGDPRLTLCIANLKLGQVALPSGVTLHATSLLDFLDVQCRDVTMHYTVVRAESSPSPPMTEEWLAGAELYLVEKRAFGGTNLPFDFDATVRLDGRLKEAFGS